MWLIVIVAGDERCEEEDDYGERAQGGQLLPTPHHQVRGRHLSTTGDPKMVDCENVYDLIVSYNRKPCAPNVKLNWNDFTFYENS